MSLFAPRKTHDQATVEAARRLVADPDAAQTAHPILRLAAWHILGDDLCNRRIARTMILAPSCGGDAA